MFCYQCEQTAKGTGCTVQGVCGKTPEISALIDQAIFAVKELARCAKKSKDRRAGLTIIEALFTTVTNVNFDPKRYQALLNKLHTTIKNDQNPTEQDYSITKRIDSLGPDITGLQEILVYGLKGMAAYADHALILGKTSEEVFNFFCDALDFLSTNPTDGGKLLEMILKCGEMNLKVMGLLDAGNTSSYGHPTPTKVRITPVRGKAILVSGHDLKDLDEILKQTEGRGINVYTHGEMLPCHGYPQLKKYKHLVGNFGGAWQEQQKEFAQFPGAILMTTNCLQRPMKSYAHRLFTTGLVGWPDIVNIANKDFAPVIEAALNEEGFKSDEIEKHITVGFGHNAVMSVADKLIDAIKSGAIKHLFLIGGCDGAKPGRNYYTELAQSLPRDCVILTLACGKYRFNKFDFGEIKGIPRLIDIGQCNDSYSAVQIALSLAKAFNKGVNDLPLSFILSWYEQKAVAVLLTLLSLGVKNIRLGPTLPAFVTPQTLKILVDKFNIMPIKTPLEDIQDILR